MKILLDECGPVQVRNALVGHDVSTAQKTGWSGVSNGELLQRAEQAGFQLFIVADKNLRYQQNLKDRKLAILELWTNHRPTLEKHLDKIKLAVERIAASEYAVLENPE
jgi:hypothetical protein